MGNTHSASTSTQSLAIKRKSSAGILKLKGSCWTADCSVTSSAGSEETCETFCEDKRPDHLPPNYASRNTKVVEDDAAVAYKAFLKAFPGYQLTWTLDNLRQSDFSRLDRTGETYVDYMGGAVYPESLIRAHTTFLNQNVLGNTHSVSNRCARRKSALSCSMLIIFLARNFPPIVQMKRGLPFFLSSMLLRDTLSFSQQMRQEH